MKQEREVIAVCLHMQYCTYIQNTKIINQALLPIPSDFDRRAAGKKKLRKNLIGKIQFFPPKAWLFTCEEV